MRRKPPQSEVEALAAEIDDRLGSLPDYATARVRALRREYSKRLAGMLASSVVALGVRLLEGPTFQHRFVAYELVSHHRGALASLRANELEQFARGLDSWGSVDAFAVYLSGPAWRERQVPDSFIARWARSKDRWLRRAALVSTVPLNLRSRGGMGDTGRTLTVCGLLIHDRDDMVVKALSWALRELAKHDPLSVRAFLAEHEAVLAARVLREVRHKLTTGLKNPRRQLSS
jgi:3-methyladenine DNA glycosylase AlkD